MAERLWAPWRMDYIKQDKPDEEGCLFCRVHAAADDAGNLVLLRGEHAYLMLNAFPYTSGHLMAAPVRHTADFTSLSAAESAELMDLARRGMRALDAVYLPQGYNVGINLGVAAGAGIADHLHVHVVPRWVGDTNFMAAVGDTRVLPESLDETYRKLHDILNPGE
jgi:ATP adenylyltransferase